MPNVKNPLTGITPKDGDIYPLTPQELKVVCPNAFAAAKGEGLRSFWATFPMDPKEPSITIAGVGWDLMGTPTKTIEDEDAVPYMWSDEGWGDTTRY